MCSLLFFMRSCTTYRNTESFLTIFPSAVNAAKIFAVYLVFDGAYSAISHMKHDQHEGAKAKAELAKIKQNAKAAGLDLH